MRPRLRLTAPTLAVLAFLVCVAGWALLAWVYLIAGPWLRAHT